MASDAIEACGRLFAQLPVGRCAAMRVRTRARARAPKFARPDARRRSAARARRVRVVAFLHIAGSSVRAPSMLRIRV